MYAPRSFRTGTTTVATSAGALSGALAEVARPATVISTGR
jgi:hypothetical protein